MTFPVYLAPFEYYIPPTCNHKNKNWCWFFTAWLILALVLSAIIVPVVVHSTRNSSASPAPAASPPPPPPPSPRRALAPSPAVQPGPSPASPLSPSMNVSSSSPSPSPAVPAGFSPAVAPADAPTGGGEVFCAVLQPGSSDVYLCTKAPSASCFAGVDAASGIDFARDSMFSHHYRSQEDCVGNITCLPAGLFGELIPYSCTFERCTVGNAMVNCVAVNAQSAAAAAGCDANAYSESSCQSCIEYVGCDHDASAAYCHQASC